MPRAGAPSRTIPPTIRSAPEVRRSTNRSPAATPIGGDSLRMAANDPSVRSSASRPLRPMLTSVAAVPSVDARAGAIRQGRREPDEHSIAGRDRRVVGQDEAPMQFARLDAGEVEGRPAEVRQVDGRTVDLDLPDADRAIARDETQRGPSAQGTPSEGPGDDGASTLDREDPIDRQARPRGRGPRAARVQDPIAQRRRAPSGRRRCRCRPRTRR